jgi:prepilin-type processing-associated H-X9-DG protein
MFDRVTTVTVIAWVVGVIFAVSASGKAVDLIEAPSASTLFLAGLDRFESPQLAGWSFIAFESTLALWLMSGLARRVAVGVSGVVLYFFAGMLLTLNLGVRAESVTCGCFGGLLPAAIAPGRGFMIAMDLCLGMACFVAACGAQRADSSRARSAVTQRTAVARGFSTVELLVALGVISILIAILVPVAVGARRSAKRTECQANLRQVTSALLSYQAESGWLPRHAYFSSTGDDVWIAQVAPYLGVATGFDWPDLRQVKVQRCPAHPLQEIPSAYNINAFAFETREDWKPSPMIPAGSVRRPTEVYLLLEGADAYGSNTGPWDDILVEDRHSLYGPNTLATRTNFARHGRGSNIGFADGHVAWTAAGEFVFDQLDDGVRERPRRWWYVD